MTLLIVCVFVAGYLAIALEHPIGLNKAASALITGALCWSLYAFHTADVHTVNEALQEHLGEIAGILFFLLGAMTIVELIDGHDGFDVITTRIRTTNKVRLLWIICFISFFLSAVLDNLTTAIVMVSLVRKIIRDREMRLLSAGMIVIAANAGGAWSPIGDVTTTMLWIGGQVTTPKLVSHILLPSIASLLVPLMFVSIRLRGELPIEEPSVRAQDRPDTPARDRNIVFYSGLILLLLVPVFKSITHLPPYMGMLFGLGLMWVITEILHSGKDEQDKNFFSVMYAIRKIDTPSILFFLGILLSVAALESLGLLEAAAKQLDAFIGNDTIIVALIGLFSSIVDNVPLVAAAMGMYPIEQHASDDPFWHLLAFCSGTGGSILIIGSAAGIAAMGIERIEFIWYLKRIAWLALIGYFAGILVFVAQQQLGL
jgi:Na+/H+ antiporter NhaD/arsenite permease-like protein